MCFTRTSIYDLCMTLGSILFIDTFCNRSRKNVFELIIFN